eukprot:137433-Amorphochlora_amoeboformis.AAC.2
MHRRHAHGRCVRISYRAWCYDMGCANQRRMIVERGRRGVEGGGRIEGRGRKFEMGRLRGV